MLNKKYNIRKFSYTSFGYMFYISNDEYRLKISQEGIIKFFDMCVKNPHGWKYFDLKNNIGFYKL